jgi:uncharacterized protein with HEPN domain
LKTARFYLEDMLDYARKAVDFASIDAGAERGMRELAFERCFEIIGEAARNVDPAVAAALPDIEFREAVSMRNRIIHGYDTLSLSILEKTARRDLPRLIGALEAALADTLPDER